MNLPVKEIINESPSISIQRNGHEFISNRFFIQDIDASDGKLRIGDSEGINLFNPINVEPGIYQVHRYSWQHDIKGEINAVVTVKLYRTMVKGVKRYIPQQNYAPHLKGIPVDSGMIKISNDSGCEIPITSGFGDGLYDMMTNKSILSRISFLLIDFKIYVIRNVIGRSGWVKDKYEIWIPPKS